MMKAWWAQQAARIDALSMRERVFMFVSVIAIGLALADVLWLEPAQKAQAQAKLRFTTQSVELGRLREELKANSNAPDPAKQVREEIAAADARLVSINQEIRTQVPVSQSGPALEQVLVQFLRRQEGLVLLSTGTLAAEATAATATAAPAAVQAGGLPPGLTKRGLELRVSGPYAELVRYVRTLENALPSLRWGALHLKSDKQPPELTLQVYVVGVQP